LQRFYGQEPQICLTMPILTGTDGVQKMSKSLGNYIGIDEPAPIMFEKIMRMNDSNIISYFILLTDFPIQKVEEIHQKMSKGADTSYILEVKKQLAFEIVRIYHPLEQAEKALAAYGTDNTDHIPVFDVSHLPSEMGLVDLVKEVFLLKSKSEARTLVAQGAVTINNQKETNHELIIKLAAGMVIKAGKSRIVKIKI